MSKPQGPPELPGSKGPAIPGWPESDLSSAEALLAEQARAGNDVDLGGETVRGSVVRRVLCSTHRRADTSISHGADATESALTITSCVIEGGLDLEGALIPRPVVFERSRIQGNGKGCAILLRDAHAKRIGLRDTFVEGSIQADRIQVDNGMFVTNCDVRGAIEICGADLGAALSLNETIFGDGARGLISDGLRVQGALSLKNSKVNGRVSLTRARLDFGLFVDGAQIDGRGDEWGINASGAHLGGDFTLENARITGALGIAHAEINGAMVADGLKLTTAREVAIGANGVNIAHGLSARYAIVKGVVALQSAKIAKGIASQGLEVSGGESSILADVITVGGNWDLASAKLVGGFSIAGARIAGQLKLTEARLLGSDLSLRADGARIEGGCFMSRAIVIGLLRFPAAYFGNQFRLRGASLKVDFGAALLASGSQFSRDVELSGGFTSAGALVFDQVEINGTMDLSESRLSCAALERVAAGVTLPTLKSPGDTREGAEAIYDEVSLSLVDSRVNRLVMPDRENHRPRGIVIFSRAHVGTYQDYAAAWPLDFDRRARSMDGRDIDHFKLDGFTYDHLGNPSGAQITPGVHSRADDRVGSRRIAWLAGQEANDIRDHFKPQPWIQLGQRLAAQGYHEDTREIAVARQRLALSSHSTSISQRWQGRILDLFALFGFNPWRTLVWMAVFIVAFAGLWSWASLSCTQDGCFDESVFVVTNRDAYTPDKLTTTYPPFNALGYSFDVFVPFVSFGYADHWRPNTNYGLISKIDLPNYWRDPARSAGTTAPGSYAAPVDGSDHAITLEINWGGVLYVLMVLEALIGLTLTSLAITGFTGLLRSD